MQRQRSVNLFRRIKFAAMGLGNIFGPPLAEGSSRPALPKTRVATSYRLGHIRLHLLPVGYVRIRNSHRELPAELAELEDGFRFLAMMADRTVTDWLVCTAWLIEHPERTILVDTGESPGFGTDSYFSDVPRSQSRVYTRIIDAASTIKAPLERAVADVGLSMEKIDLCILTHTHSDHLGNLGSLSLRTPIQISPDELSTGGQSGRLLSKLPRDGRLIQTAWKEHDGPFDKVMSLTSSGDIFLTATPGHTVGHQSVVMSLPDRYVVIAGDLAFDDQQVLSSAMPGMVESRQKTLNTYDRLRRLSLEKPTTSLFSHDSSNASKLVSLEV